MKSRFQPNLRQERTLVLDTGPGHWTCTLGLDTGPGHWAWTLGLDNGPGHWARTLGLDTGPGHWTWTLDPGTGPGHWACTLGLHTGPGQWAWTMGLENGLGEGARPTAARGRHTGEGASPDARGAGINIRDQQIGRSQQAAGAAWKPRPAVNSYALARHKRGFCRGYMQCNQIGDRAQQSSIDSPVTS